VQPSSHVLLKGAFIGWTVGPAYDGFSGFNAIQINGTLVSAIDIASSGSLTVDPGGLNITFLAAGNPLGGFTFDAGDPGSTDANWNAIINTGDFCSCQTKPFPNFLSGLTIGNTYQIQLFANDSRGCCSSRSQFYDDGLGNSSPIVVQGSFLSTIGIFTADATSQAINFNLVLGNPGDPNAMVLSAYVLRDITSTSAVPEPSTAFIGRTGRRCGALAGWPNAAISASLTKTSFAGNRAGIDGVCSLDWPQTLRLSVCPIRFEKFAAGGLGLVRRAVISRQTVVRPRKIIYMRKRLLSLRRQHRQKVQSFAIGCRRGVESLQFQKCLADHDLRISESRLHVFVAWVIQDQLGFESRRFS